MPEAPGASPKEMSVASARRLLTGHWVLMEVTRVNQHNTPTRGKVIIASPDRQEVSEALRLQPREASPGAYYIFRASQLTNSKSNPNEAEALADELNAELKALRLGLA